MIIYKIMLIYKICANLPGGLLAQAFEDSLTKIDINNIAII